MSPREVRKPHWEGQPAPLQRCSGCGEVFHTDHACRTKYKIVMDPASREPRIPLRTLLNAVGVALAALVMGFVMGWMLAAVAG